MKYDEVSKMSDEQLVETRRSLRKELFDLKTTAVTEQIEDNQRFGKLRKDVARVSTELRSREIAAAQPQQA